MGGVILVDAAGAALTNYLSWRDQRTQQPHGPVGSYLDAIRARWTGAELAELGNELQAGSASSLLIWLAEKGQLPAGAMPATVADYVIGRLCSAPPQMDPTHAIGLLDLRSGTWHRAALDALGLSRVQWPQLADSRRPVGHWSAGGRSIACHASFGDQQCALRGVGLTRQELSLNISTGSQVSRRTAAFEPGPYQTRRYFGGDYLNTITNLPAGRSLNVLYDLLTELARAEDVTLTNPWKVIAENAASADGGGLNVDLAFFAGPLGTSGRVEGITTENLTVGNLFHAAFRAMVDNYVRCADRLCPDRTGLSLALSGGLTRSVPILRQLIQDRFALPFRESAAAEETLLGLLAIARDVYPSA
jgi:sugar (pentulose or hexulose) kinase